MVTYCVSQDWTFNLIYETPLGSFSSDDINLEYALERLEFCCMLVTLSDWPILCFYWPRLLVFMLSESCIGLNRGTKYRL